MTPEELAAALAAAVKPLQDGLAAVTAQVAALKAAPDKAAADKAAADAAAKAASDKVASDKAAADKAAADAAAAGKTPAENALAIENKRIMDAMKAEVDRLTASSKAAEDRAKELAKSSALDRILADYSFVAPSARQTALTLLNSAATANDAGELVANNLPVADFAKDFLTVQNPYLLAPANTPGTGAINGTGGIARGTTATLEMIKPGMSDADRAAVNASIKASLASLAQ